MKDIVEGQRSRYIEIRRKCSGGSSSGTADDADNKDFATAAAGSGGSGSGGGRHGSTSIGSKYSKYRNRLPTPSSSILQPSIESAVYSSYTRALSVPKTVSSLSIFSNPPRENSVKLLSLSTSRGKKSKMKKTSNIRNDSGGSSSPLVQQRSTKSIFYSSPNSIHGENRKNNSPAKRTKSILKKSSSTERKRKIRLPKKRVSFRL